VNIVDLENRIIGTLVARLNKAGWTLDAYYDCDDYVQAFVPCRTSRALKEWVTQVEDVDARFTRRDGRSHTVRLIAGNGVDIVSDWTVARDRDDDFDATMDAITDYIMNTYEG
jgi:hypothetical protein